MKVVFFGDSNTWGYDGEFGCQQKNRYTRQLAGLHPDWEVVEEGLNGRTMGGQNPYGRSFSGIRQIESVIRKNAPFDVLVIALGTNDALQIPQGSAKRFEQILEDFIQTLLPAAAHANPTAQRCEILLVQPPVPGMPADFNPFFQIGDAARHLLDNCGPIFEKAAKKYGLHLLRSDGSILVEGSESDGVHLDGQGHTRLARLLSFKLEEIADGLKEKVN